MHPYTKIAFVERDLKVLRLGATKYLDALADGDFLKKQRMGRANYYVNVALNAVLASVYGAEQPRLRPADRVLSHFRADSIRQHRQKCEFRRIACRAKIVDVDAIEGVTARCAQI